MLRKEPQPVTDIEESFFKKYISEDKKKVHYCREWDGLVIHEESPEFEACLCYD